ncbi:hypothetical protein ABK040_010043 [Willaertia magna]
MSLSRNVLSITRKTSSCCQLFNKFNNVQIRSKYSANVIDHTRKPRNSGKLDDKADNVGSALVGAPSCGDVLKFQILVDDDGKVIDAKFKTFGCGSAIASSSYATELVKGKTVEACMKITNNDIASHLSLPPVKKHCSLLAEQAIRQATEDYLRKKNAKAAGNQSTTTIENNEKVSEKQLTKAWRDLFSAPSHSLISMGNCYKVFMDSYVAKTNNISSNVFETHGEEETSTKSKFASFEQKEEESENENDILPSSELIQFIKNYNKV